MKLKSFGCSFIYGADLQDSTRTWPALIARKLGMDYECYAVPGSGNLQILEAILSQLYKDEDSFFVINWTWIDRFDFISIKDEKWQTLRPALDHSDGKYYYRCLHSQYRDMLTNLAYVKTAVDALSQRNLKSVMTYMDYLLFEKINPNWHDPSAVEYLQNSIFSHMSNFSDKNFLDWSRDQGHPVSESWHPLDDAHVAAADYMIPVLQDALHKI